MQKKKRRNLKIILFLFLGCLAFPLAAALITYPPEYVYRVLIWQESDAFDWQKFPPRLLKASPEPLPLTQQTDPRVEELFKEISGEENWSDFLESTGTQAFIVLRGQTLLMELYLNNTGKESIVTSFSVAKSFTSALIGIAVDEGYIQSIDDPITRYLPELSQRDYRFNTITIKDLLLMSSGLEYRAFRPLFLNGDDPLTTYYPDQRKVSLENTRITRPPGEIFLYNKYHPQLLGMILERTTNMPVTTYLQTRIWDPLGMEFDGSWSLDSTTSGFEKMETGINARAVDFAKFGLLYAEKGQINTKKIIPEKWIKESTQPYFPENYNNYYNDWVKTMPGKGYYSYMWWGIEKEDSSYDFCAEGDKGQFIYVCPEKDLVIVRNGEDYGIPSKRWMSLFQNFTHQYTSQE